QLSERRIMGGFAGSEPHLAAHLSKLIPRTDRQTIVAAVNAVSHRCAELMRDLPLMLNCKIGDAAARVEPVWSRESLCRAGVEAAVAGTATISVRRIRRQFRGCENRAQEEP